MPNPVRGDLFIVATPPHEFHAALVANTYSQIYIQVVFAVQCRQYLIRPEFREEVQRYITGITTERGQKLLSIY